MATGRFISQREARDSTLNSMPLSHILAFDRVVVFADDWGRYSGSPDQWKQDLFPLQKHMTAEIVLAIQHDLAEARLLGFYTDGNSEYCLIYKFLKYQTIRATHRKAPQYPTPPEEMWWMFLHPMDTAKSYDVPDMPREHYKAVLRSTVTRNDLWAPSTPRPNYSFEVSEIMPFGGVLWNQRETPKEKQAPKPVEKPATSMGSVQAGLPGLIEGPMSGAKPTPVEAGLLHVIKNAKGMGHHWNYGDALQQIRTLWADYSEHIDIQHVVKAWAAGTITKPLTKSSRPWSSLRNWCRLEKERKEKGWNGKRAVAQKKEYEEGEVML